MGVACPKCGNEDLRLDPISQFRLGIPHLREMHQAVVVLSCRPCRTNFQFRTEGRSRPSFSHFMHVWGQRQARATSPPARERIVVVRLEWQGRDRRLQLCAQR